MAQANLLSGYASDPSSEEQDHDNDKNATIPPPPVNLTSAPSLPSNPSNPPNPPNPSQTKLANPKTLAHLQPPSSPKPHDPPPAAAVPKLPSIPSNQTSTPSPPARPSHPPLPPDVARELSRSGHLPSDVTFINVDARASTHLTPPSHTPAPTLAIQSRANRIAKSSTHISRLERRKHQITALAADAQALETARRALGGSALSREMRGRRGGRR